MTSSMAQLTAPFNELGNHVPSSFSLTKSARSRADIFPDRRSECIAMISKSISRACEFSSVSSKGSPFMGHQIVAKSIIKDLSSSALTGRHITRVIFTGTEPSLDLINESHSSNGGFSRSNFDTPVGLASSSLASSNSQKNPNKEAGTHNNSNGNTSDSEMEKIWQRIRFEAREDSEAEPALASYLYSTILAHKSIFRSLSFHLGNKLSSNTLLPSQLMSLIYDSFMEDATLREALLADICAVKEKDPACRNYSHCLLNFKGFLACQAHRVAHRLWLQRRCGLALAIQSRMSEVFQVDIHPGAAIGKGLMFDHATGLVVGETAIIGNNVSILHHVTLGGTGVGNALRHPHIRDGVLIGAGATLLGPIVVGEGAKIGAGSVVLSDIPPHTTAVGNPARLLGGKAKPKQMVDTPSDTMDHTSFISEWSDYTI